jgi:hypothetical protein
MMNVVNPAYEGAFFDLDLGQVTNSPAADIYLAVSCGSQCFNIVLAVNGAETIFMYRETTHEPGYDGCRKALSEERLVVSGVSTIPSEFSCLRTNDGHIAQILAIDNKPSGIDSEFSFQFKLWNDHP